MNRPPIIRTSVPPPAPQASDVRELQRKVFALEKLVKNLEFASAAASSGIKEMRAKTDTLGAGLEDISGLMGQVMATTSAVSADVAALKLQLSADVAALTLQSGANGAKLDKLITVAELVKTGGFRSFAEGAAKLLAIAIAAAIASYFANKSEPVSYPQPAWSRSK